MATWSSGKMERGGVTNRLENYLRTTRAFRPEFDSQCRHPIGFLLFNMKGVIDMWKWIKKLLGIKPPRCHSCQNYRPDHTGFNGGTCDGNNEYGCSYLPN